MPGLIGMTSQDFKWQGGICSDKSWCHCFDVAVSEPEGIVLLL